MKTAQSIQSIPIRTWLVRGALILNISLGLSYIGMWLVALQQDLVWYSDFSAFYTGWAIVRDGRGAQLYDFDLQAHYQRQMLEGRVFRDNMLPYVNPPYATIPFVPLSWLRLIPAYMVWSLGQLLLLAWLLYLLWQVTRTWGRHEHQLLFSAVLALPSLMITFVLGTFSIYMTICLLQLYLMLKRTQEIRAGLWLVLGTIKPQLMLIPSLMLLGARRWRALASALLIGGALVALSGLVLGWTSWVGFVQALRYVNTLFGLYIYPSQMYNFRGTLTLLLGNDRGPLINQISAVGTLIAGAVTLWLWRGRWRPDQPSFELLVALTMLIGLLFIPHLYPYDTLALVVPGTLFYAYLRQRQLPRRAYAVFALTYPLLMLVSEYVVKDSLGILLPVVAMVALAVWIARALIAEGRTPTTPNVAEQYGT